MDSSPYRLVIPNIKKKNFFLYFINQPYRNSNNYNLINCRYLNIKPVILIEHVPKLKIYNLKPKHRVSRFQHLRVYLND